MVVLIHGGLSARAAAGWACGAAVPRICWHAATPSGTSSTAGWPLRGGGYPGTLDDVGAAVDHLRELAARQPAAIVKRGRIVGHSAGGHLALWAAGPGLGVVPRSGSARAPSSTSPTAVGRGGGQRRGRLPRR